MKCTHALAVEKMIWLEVTRWPQLIVSGSEDSNIAVAITQGRQTCDRSPGGKGRYALFAPGVDWGMMPLLARYYRTVYPLRLHRIDMRRRLSDYCTNPLSDPQVDGRRSLHDLKATKDRINERVAHFDVGRARSRAPIAERTTVWKKLDRLLACFSARLDADWQTALLPIVGRRANGH